MATQVTNPHRERQLNQWLDCVRGLLDAIRQWSEEQGWPVAEDKKNIREDSLGDYTAPILHIRTPDGQLFVEPIAREILGGAEGRVDLEAWPSLNRVKLLRTADRWQAVTDSGVPLHEPWDQQRFVQLVKDLVSHR
ncbi:MAG TPA: hypothetical protein VG722_07905 [Tepidisphaeraceae bacterium]|nr:hypothetical protein [Tepidisphaeraceae bacterium]